MKILILSLYYEPDVCAGSFRCTALVKQLRKALGKQGEIEVITAMPNRYTSFNAPALELEYQPGLTIKRIKLSPHDSTLMQQIKSYIYFIKAAHKLTKSSHYSLVFATSSRLMTAVLGAWIAHKKKAKLYLDIRDIFISTINDLFSKKKSFLIKPLITFLEHWSFHQAQRINLVSPGFKSYFLQYYPTVPLSWFTNGIDMEFMTIKNTNIPTLKTRSKPLTILYAGNIGQGQGLQKIIPELAKLFKETMIFRVIGDGGKQDALIKKVRDLECTNVEVLKPLSRNTLIKEYENADVLFLHLNDYNAFQYVLPSKLFEYAATGKPIWAGVLGYAAEFMKTEIENVAIFEPCNILEAEEAFNTLDLNYTPRTEFIMKYARDNIMQSMAADILSLI